MALKDIGKIVANQGAAKEDAVAAASDSGVTPAARAERASFDKKAESIKPGTNKPADTTGHKGFKYQSGNPFHEDILKTLRDSGNLGKVVVHEGGAMSLPKDVAYGLGKKFETATDFAQGGEMSFTKPSDSVVPAARKSEKDSKTPSSRPTKTVLETVGDALAAGAAKPNVDQERAMKRREMEARQEKINENLRRKRGGK